MKISIVTGFFLPVPPVRGGSTEKIWYRLAQEFAAAGHDVTFVSRRWPGFADRETVAGVSHVRVPGAAHSRSLAVNLWLDFWWGIRVARVLPPADVVICNTVTLPVWLRRRRPRAGRVAVVVARMPKGHGRAYGGVDLLLSLSDAVSARLRAENPRLVDRIVPFPYPIDWRRQADAATARPAALKQVNIGYVGRIHPEKGIELLLAAATRLHAMTDLADWRLELVGPWTVPEGGGGAAFVQTLQQRFAPLGSRLTFAGPEFDPDQLAQRYAGMDIFCYPSVSEAGETFGVAVAEAMAARCVPVVSQLPCFAGLVQEGITGRIFDHSAPEAAARLANVLTQLISDGAQRERLAGAAQEHARQFDFAFCARALLPRLEASASGGERTRHREMR